MTTILHVSSSSNLQNSVTRNIGSVLLGDLRVKYPNAKIIERDVVKNPIPHLTPEMIAVFYQPDAPELAISDSLVDEVLQSDILVIEAPMYNFSISSSLKAWIDYIVRAGKTFQYSATGPEGLTKNKKAILILGRGGVYSVGAYQSLDYQESYLRMILGFIGITDVQSVYIEGVGGGAEKTADALVAAKQQIFAIAV